MLINQSGSSVDYHTLVSHTFHPVVWSSPNPKIQRDVNRFVRVIILTLKL